MATIPVAANGDIIQLARTNPLHYTANGVTGPLGGKANTASSVDDPSAFENALIKAMDGVNADQMKSNDLVEQMLVDPDSVDAHEITIGMAEASLSLNLAKTLLSRVVTAWKDVINTR